MQRRENHVVIEEVFNAVIHGVGAGFGIVGYIILLVTALKSNSSAKILSFSVFGVSLILMYLSSTLFHSLLFTRARNVFRLLDHSAIFLFIAGTYTPLVLLVLKGSLGLALIIFIWTMVICGVFFKIFCMNRSKISLVLYLFLGWIGVFMLKPLLLHLTVGGVLLLIVGGVLYTIGAVFYTWRKLIFNHGIWHLFVLGGSTCHFAAMFYL